MSFRPIPDENYLASELSIKKENTESLYQGVWECPTEGCNSHANTSCIHYDKQEDPQWVEAYCSACDSMIAIVPG